MRPWTWQQQLDRLREEVRRKIRCDEPLTDEDMALMDEWIVEQKVRLRDERELAAGRQIR